MNYTKMKQKEDQEDLGQLAFKNAQCAFEYYYKKISKGIDFSNTKAIFNEGFYLLNPRDNEIKTCWRNWKKDYAELEFNWYLSENPNANIVAEKAKIWYNIMDEHGNVNSNYGYQFSRGNQIEYIISELTKNQSSRRASMSVYDAKENEKYSKDTPCTYAVNFYILDNKLNMSVLMRSCDLWFGFCNDQYCFSKYQELIADKLNLNIGTYFHFVNNFHIYNDKLNKCV